jgi:hypothetical protein
VNLARIGRRAADAATRLDWIDLAVLGGAILAAAANIAAGAWVVVPVVALMAFVIVRASWWRTEFEAECQSHDFTQHQLDEARAEVRRLSGDVVRWADFGGQR